MKAEWKAFLEDAGAEFDGERVAHFGNPEREREVGLSGLVFADLEYMGVIAVHGSDAGTFLQSQLSNDIRALDEGRSQLNAFCTPKGRMLGLMRIFRTDDGYYLRLPADTLEAVLQRLRLYVLRSNVTLEDASDNFLRIGISGMDADNEIRGIAGACPDTVNSVARAGPLTVIRVPAAEPRFEVYASSLQAAQTLWDALNVRGAPVGEPVWRLLEIRNGLPVVFTATAELFVPQMANLQLVDGVSFKKGCYPGQEIVARMQYLGTLKRRMYLGQVEYDGPIAPGAELYSGRDGDQATGRIVDAQPYPDGGQLALAVLQIQAADAADVFLGSPAGPAFDIRPLPYSFPVEQTD
ncbi:MAG TPA: folate-binding protein [Gammaproteobacteria bacterium]|nr:folate-binding protein [Gammaproteobacteria bacterium]